MFSCTTLIFGEKSLNTTNGAVSFQEVSEVNDIGIHAPFNYSAFSLDHACMHAVSIIIQICHQFNSPNTPPVFEFEEGATVMELIFSEPNRPPFTTEYLHYVDDIRINPGRKISAISQRDMATSFVVQGPVTNVAWTNIVPAGHVNESDQ